MKLHEAILLLVDQYAKHGDSELETKSTNEFDNGIIDSIIFWNGLDGKSEGKVVIVSKTDPISIYD